MEYLQNGCVNVCNLVKCRPLKDLSLDITFNPLSAAISCRGHQKRQTCLL